MLKHTSIISLIVLTFFNVFAQEHNIKPDGIGGFWYLDGSKSIRINEQAEVLATYSNLQLGSPSNIDPMDPFRVMLFFENSQQLQFININGNPIGNTVNLWDFGINEVTLACRSSRGGVWLFSSESNEIVLTNNLFSRTEQKISLSFLANNKVPNILLESDGILYIGFDNRIIERYDIYGTRLPALQINYNQIFNVQKGLVWVKNDDFVDVYDIRHPYYTKESFECPCQSIPITIKNKIVCFDGNNFKPCEKKSNNNM